MARTKTKSGDMSLADKKIKNRKIEDFNMKEGNNDMPNNSKNVKSTISISTTLDVKQRVTNDAKAVGMSVSSYVSELIMNGGKTVVALPENKELLKLISQNHDILIKIVECKVYDGIHEQLDTIIENDSKVFENFAALIYKIDALMRENDADNGGDD